MYFEITCFIWQRVDYVGESFSLITIVIGFHYIVMEVVFIKLRH